MEAAGNKKEFAPILEWVRSIINHLYWAVMSTNPGDFTMITAKWESVINHIQNIHDGHGSRLPKCLHGVNPPATVPISQKNGLNQVSMPSASIYDKK